MTKEEYRAAIDNVIWLCGCAVNKTTPDSEKISNINLEHLYKAAHKHMLTATTAYALRSAGIIDKSFEQARTKSVRKIFFKKNEPYDLPGYLISENKPERRNSL